jgi:hypothetical protein
VVPHPYNSNVSKQTNLSTTRVCGIPDDAVKLGAVFGKREGQEIESGQLSLIMARGKSATLEGDGRTFEEIVAEARAHKQPVEDRGRSVVGNSRSGGVPIST